MVLRGKPANRCLTDEKDPALGSIHPDALRPVQLHVRAGDSPGVDLLPAGDLMSRPASVRALLQIQDTTGNILWEELIRLVSDGRFGLAASKNLPDAVVITKKKILAGIFVYYPEPVGRRYLSFDVGVTGQKGQKKVNIHWPATLVHFE